MSRCSSLGNATLDYVLYFFFMFSFMQLFLDIVCIAYIPEYVHSWIIFILFCILCA